MVLCPRVYVRGRSLAFAGTGFGGCELRLHDASLCHRAEPVIALMNDPLMRADRTAAPPQCFWLG